MPTTLSSVVTVSASASLIPALDFGNAVANLAETYGSAWTPGTAAAQVNSVYWKTRTLAASVSEQLDLAGATLFDPFGNAVSMARIKALIISAAAANTNTVLVGGGTNALASLFGAAAHTTPVRPGGAVMWLCGITDATGYVVTPATGDLLQIANGGAGTPVTYSIVAVGVAT